MESCVTANKEPEIAEIVDVKNTDSAENFQKFIYELFEKNGVLNDLRAYLRGHIVNILKSAQTDEPPLCQQKFTQRLELPFQALNILIAEYLLRLEFNYSLSVFVTEIPLANMVFGFAKTLMKSSDDGYGDLRFKDADVWSILNYLGIKCDSDHASSIVEMYKREVCSPLLLCILKCVPMYTKDSIGIEQVNSSEESTPSSVKSLDTLEDDKTKTSHRNIPFHDKCKHYVFCKTCQSKMIRIKEKYRRKKKKLTENIKETNINSLTVESLMKNIGVIEKCLIDEMFQQLKTVYENEVEMVKAEEEKKVKRSLASHSLQLQKRRDEMEATFRARESELERNVQQKKKFLWSLARALRDQHARVRGAAGGLAHKEDSLKTQLAEAEEILKQRGEDMRAQISSELTILEGHLDSMKKERDSINKERSELEHLKTLCDTASQVIKVHHLESDDLRSHYELLTNELSILKKYIETTKLEPKCVIETGTMTELCGVTSNLNVIWNNGQDTVGYVKSDDVNIPNQVINNLKKQKNVNQSNVAELYRDRGRGRSRSSASSEPGDALLVDNDIVQQLRDENERLKALARQQRSHIDELSRQQARPRAEPAAACRPRVAHAPHSMNGTSSASNFNFEWRKGAGEQLSIFSNAQPRIVVPGDTLPFIGVLRDRDTNNRRHLISQWRSLRRRVSPAGGVAKPRTAAPAHRDRSIRLVLGGTGHNASAPATLVQAPSPRQQLPEKKAFVPFRESFEHRPKTTVTETNNRREKSPNSVLREAKENLRNKTTIKDHPPAPRAKSPNSVLREAKLRLRKLEIEAEAVEQSYIDFRRRQSELRDERKHYHTGDKQDVVIDLDIKRSRSMNRKGEMYESEMNALYRKAQDSIKNDFEKYFKEYQTEYSVGEVHFKNRNTTAEKIKLIPKYYSKINEDTNQQENYLETPLTEFRKFYHSGIPRAEKLESPTKSIFTKKEHNVKNNEPNVFESRRGEALTKENNKMAEFELLKHNIGKIYNLKESIESTTNEIEDKNLLTVEVECVKESNDIKVADSQDLLLIVQSSVDNRNLTVSESEDNRDIMSTKMTIIVSPKEDNLRNELTGQQAVKLTKDDVLDAIFHAGTNKGNSSVQMQLELSKDILEDSISNYDKEGEDYGDDFSADVDNYNARSDYENNSPISLPKTSEDENFWDS